MSRTARLRGAQKIANQRRQDNRSAWFSWRGDDLRLAIYAQPRAQQDAVDGLFGERLRIRVHAPPATGQANAALEALLAREFHVRRIAVQIELGRSARNKTVHIQAPRDLPAWFVALGGRRPLR